MVVTVAGTITRTTEAQPSKAKVRTALTVVLTPHIRQTGTLLKRLPSHSWTPWPIVTARRLEQPVKSDLPRSVPEPGLPP